MVFKGKRGEKSDKKEGPNHQPVETQLSGKNGAKERTYIKKKNGKETQKKKVIKTRTKFQRSNSSAH